ncbi:alginate O-acetyltransferase AlgF [Shimia sagamensis]|uniref:Alginate biosynthesis protein AlgF n=1 Tax=Shimia sagamensis TaxID=1566352 RepID=A0ABY1NKM5_9RHOB|nr:alginate O-acetyltransferase AlgF [Shimia sagamensis]SMP11866.1 Alginate O-acetyl transferase AlgF [Shimia sagamensis]
MHRSRIAAFLIFAVSIPPSSVWAADNELYDAPPPEDAVFVRWIEEETAPRVLGIRMPEEPGDVFYPVSAALTDGGLVGSFYTAAVDAKGNVHVIREPDRGDRSKVLLTLLNLTDEHARLVLSDQNIDVIGTTDINSAGSRTVNPVAATLSVVTSSGAVLGRFDVQLRRGQTITFVARPDGADLIENRFGPNIGG